MKKVNLAEKFNLFNEHWSPYIVGELNGQYVKLAKFKGEFMWHSHAKEDELFLVVKGTLRIEFRDGIVTLNEGEFYIVPKGVEHKPVADEEAHVMLLEPKSTEQTGGIESNLLVDKQPRI
ncbi:cupin domain-containing protein (plasmid) [Legionella lytica]|jgi:mannose-6-phosphate isomerase-like protein (cupin superfamily)|uniref:Cupin domain-containing protein n=1 Tax=Legionella lytica TaxID=96232 RepID=A0ABY4YD32_9GAMM|nr:cupin domain-containing protein [Legionella lytica]USQ15229.1 cupin domain-containing protein [Legionella lytica]USQ15506.1 cupin domain-containing protein [Legionella lytica]